MLRAYRKYGVFEWDLIEECTTQTLRATEQRHLDAHIGSKGCLNISSSAENPFTCPLNIEKTRERNRNLVWTPEMRAKISQAHTGKKPKSETVELWKRQRAGTLNGRAKLSDEQWEVVFELRSAGMTLPELANRFEVDRTTIQRGCSKKGIFNRPKKWSEKTRATIMAARKEKPYSRDNFGIKNPRAKLNPEKVDDIRRRRNAGEKQADLAREYKVNPNTIAAIEKNLIWKIKS